MSRSLLVFIGSPNVDPYVNAMANSVDKYDVNDIVLIKVDGIPSLGNVDANVVKQNILVAVADLVNGIYRGLPAPKAKNCEAYKKLQGIFNDSYHVKKIYYQLLRENIKKFKKEYGANALVDISGLPKKVAIDVLTACLAADMEYVMLFELNRPPEGEKTLYHNLTERDYEYVKLPDWKPLLGNIESFSARQNRSKLWGSVIAILLSIGLVLGYQLVRVDFGDQSWISWLLVIAIAAIGLFGGITPIIEAWGGLHLILRSRKI